MPAMVGRKLIRGLAAVWIASVPVVPGLCAQDTCSQPKLVNSEVTEGLGLPFSEAVRVGDLLFLSGMIGIRPGTMDLVPGGLEPEARQALENIRMTLGAAGAGVRDIVKCTIMLDDIGQWDAFNRVYADFFGDHRPARSAFGAEGLALGAAVEVECLAVVPGRGG
jgi:reactive intermediate/imine deaminase